MAARSGARGEVYLTTKSGEVTLLFTIRALAEAEKTLGRGVLQILQSGTEKDIRIGDLATLIQIGMNAARIAEGQGGKKYTYSDGLQVIEQVGFQTVVGPLFTGLANVLLGESDEEDDNPPA